MTSTEEPMHLGLRAPAHRVSSRAPLLWFIGATIRALVATAILVGLVIGPVPAPPAWAWVLWALVAVGYVAVMPLFRYRVHRWESTETAVFTQVGWLSRERRIAPMSRVQTVDLEQGAVARLLRLATVTVTTASAAGPLTVQALDLPVAERLVEELTRRTADEPGDAT